ncbi:MAG: PD40 domain-containing protein [Chloroflexi bacterium]|nr:PD40 domain-containing protein [Chloroflexota bacterium]
MCKKSNIVRGIVLCVVLVLMLAAASVAWADWTACYEGNKGYGESGCGYSWIGELYVNVGGTNMVMFCFDLDNYIYKGDCYQASGQTPCPIGYILSKYGTPALPRNNHNACVVQQALWYYTDGFSPCKYTDEVNALIAEAEANCQQQTWPSLQITPAHVVNELPGDTSHTFTIRAEHLGQPAGNRDVTVTTNFGSFSPSDPNVKTITVKTDGMGDAQFTIYSTTAGTANITAEAMLAWPAGTYFMYIGSGHQNMLLATPSEMPVRAYATKTWMGTGTIIAHKFADDNMNGVQDPSEANVQGWKMKLYKKVGSNWDYQTKKDTDYSGNAIFTGLSAGQYRVVEEDKSGWMHTDPSDGKREVTLGTGESATLMFGNVELKVIQVIKFNDKNGNGSENPGEDRLGGWEFTLYRKISGAWDWVGTKTTEYATGAAIWTDQPTGDYKLVETPQGGWDVTTSGGLEQEFQVKSANDVVTRKFGNRQTCQNAGQFSVEFVSVVNNPNNTQTWCYRVTNLASGQACPALSHWDLDLCDDPMHEVLSSDPNTNQFTDEHHWPGHGHLIKWEYSIEPGQSAVFCFTLNGIWSSTQVGWFTKAGQETDTGTVTGPSCEGACTPPTIQCPGDITVCNDPGQCSAVVTWPAPTATGTPPLTVWCVPASGSTFPVGTTQVTCYAQNSCGTASCTFNVTVKDCEKPVISCPPDKDLGCNPEDTSPSTAGYATATDNCDPSPSITYSDSSSTSGCVTTITRTWKATDDCGNEATCVQKITFTSDEVKPVISCPPDKDLGCNPEDTSPSAAGYATATDNCDPSPSITYSDSSSTSGCVTTITRTWKATDDCGNEATCVQKITFTSDEVKPVISCPPDKTLYVNAECEAEIPDLTAEVVASDNCDQTLTITQSPVAGTKVGPGVYKVTLTVTDDCGNSATCETYVTVLDGLIGDYVWHDGNQDKAQDPWEFGLANITVCLRDKYFNLIRCTETDALGYYEFDCLPLGDYWVQVDEYDPNLPAGAFLTTANNPKPVVLTCDRLEYRDADFGFAWWTPVVLGSKFHDVVNIGQKDPDEPLLSGWTIIIRDAAGREVYRTQTGADGKWLLTTPLVGNHTIEEVPQEGWIQTYPDTNNGVYRVHFNHDGTYRLLSPAPTGFEGLDFGNAMPLLGCPDCVDEVIFQSDRDGNWEIYRMKNDGSEQTRLTFNDADDTAPTWHPTGFWVFFQSFRDENWEIYRMNRDGSAQVNLTENPATDIAPSAGCPWVAFQSDRDGNWEIYRMNLDGTDVIRLTNHEASDAQPAWDADCRTIAFQSDRDGNWEIYRMDQDGNNLVRLTYNDAADVRPVWSSDGQWIAFQSNRGGEWDIWVMDVNGENVTNITNFEANDKAPAWFPSCDWIFFQSDRDEPGNWDIYRTNQAGTIIERLTYGPHADLIENGGMSLAQIITYSQGLEKRDVTSK